MPETVKSVVRLVDVAQKAKVSKMTVARVLHGSGGGSIRVGKSTADRIQKIAREMNYSPNLVARQLAGKRSQMIGVIIDSFAPQSDFDKLSEMEQIAAKRGYRFMVGQSHDQFAGIEAYALDFAARGTDGIICISHQYPDFANKVSVLFSRFKNVVFVHRPSLVDDTTCFVDADVADGIRTAYRYLLARGRRRIALNVMYYSQTGRLDGYRQALAEAGTAESRIFDLPGLNPLNFRSEHNEQVVTAALEKQIRLHRIDAVLAASDIIACMMIRSLGRLGKRVPEDVAIVAYEDLELGFLYNPKLTTLDPCNKEQSQTAMTLLLDLIEGKPVPAESRQVVFKPKLIVRESA